MLIMHGLSYGPALTRNTKERASGCCCCFSHSAHWLPTRKTTLHGGRSRSWSAEQGKKENRKSLAASPPPPPQRAARSEKNKNKNHATHPHVLFHRRYGGRRYAGGLRPSRVRTRIPTTRRLGQWVSLCKILRFRVRWQLSQSRYLSLLLAMSGRVFLFFLPRGHEPPPTLRNRLNPNLSL